MHKRLLSTLISSVLMSTAVSAEDSVSNDWKASLITDFVYFDNSSAEFPEMEGFPMGGHMHGPKKGLQIGHWEAMLEGDLSDNLKARVNLAMSDPKDEDIEFEWEEVYLQTKGLGNGLKFTLGRSFTELGYHTSKHGHEWDFVDQPLIIDAIYGAHPTFDGARMNWVAPTDQYLELGLEASDGESFPAKGGETISLFAKTGSDIDQSNSWLAGLGVYRANDVDNRTHPGHEHEGEEHEPTVFSGDVDIVTLGAVYKWAPMGNVKAQNFTLQAEYFRKNEEGSWTWHEEGPPETEETESYDGKHSGFYAQAVYQWQPNWRVGYRFEKIQADNYIDGNKDELEHAGLGDEHKPKRQSLMLDYSPSHESRVRLQYNRDERSSTTDDQWYIQYTHSFGSHGAHAY